MDYLKKLIIDIELHSVEGIRTCFENGVNPNAHFNGKPLIYELISEYTRSPRFKQCVGAFVDYGLIMEDKALLAVLLDDAPSLLLALREKPDSLLEKYTLRCAYTPLYKVSLLHVCAEFNHVACAQVLVEHNADINAPAGLNEHGFGGQTPIFHTVNQNGNQSFDMLNYFLAKSANVQVTVAGIIWGQGYEWETLVPAVNPVSYAMMGLLPQMHRDEATTFKIVSLLLKAAYNINYTPPNVPCAYLKK